MGKWVTKPCLVSFGLGEEQGEEETLGDKAWSLGLESWERHHLILVEASRGEYDSSPFLQNPKLCVLVMHDT